jgi:hypothetical protein
MNEYKKVTRDEFYKHVDPKDIKSMVEAEQNLLAKGEIEYAILKEPKKCQ